MMIVQGLRLFILIKDIFRACTFWGWPSTDQLGWAVRIRRVHHFKTINIPVWKVRDERTS